MLTDQFFVIAEWGHDFTLIILILLSIFSLAFIMERALVLGKIKSQSERISERMREVLQTLNWGDLEELGKDRDSLEGRAMGLAFRHIKEKGAQGLDEIFNSYSLIEKQSLEKHLSFLATVGSNAPFIGLLGTVFGIMDAFRGLATSQGDATAVMLGISKALVATAVGLFVAIPAVIAYNYFQKKVRGIMQNLDTSRDLCLSYAKAGRGPK